MPLIGPVSGSHTHLGDGSSYLVAGSNVTITSGTGEAVTIAASGGGSTDPAGSNTQVQFNNGGSFGADSDFFFVAAQNLLNVPNLSAAGVMPATAFNAVVISSGSEQVSPGSDTLLFVSGNHAGTHRSVFGGDAIVSGSLIVGSDVAGKPSSTALNVYANVSGDFAAIIDNDQSSNGHILKLLTDGNGSGSTMLELEDGDGDTLFKARADGRFGFGPSGVSSMGAGTFVVGIDGGHTADIAISKRLQHLGDSNTFMDFPQADAINFQAGGVEMLTMAETNDTGMVLILSGGASSHPDPTDNIDTNVFVSGSMGSRGTAVRGTAVFGGDLAVSGTMFGMAGTQISNDYQTVGFASQLMSGMGRGEYLIFSPGANEVLAAGSLYFLHTDGTWNLADATSTLSGSNSKLGIGLGGPSQMVGVFTKGYYRIPASKWNGTFVTGSSVFVSDDTPGEFDAAAPSSSGEYVRVVGYALAIDGSSGDVLIDFDPDATFLEIS